MGERTNLSIPLVAATDSRIGSDVEGPMTTAARDAIDGECRPGAKAKSDDAPEGAVDSRLSPRLNRRPERAVQLLHGPFLWERETRSLGQIPLEEVASSFCRRAIPTSTWW